MENLTTATSRAAGGLRAIIHKEYIPARWGACRRRVEAEEEVGPRPMAATMLQMMCAWASTRQALGRKAVQRWQYLLVVRLFMWLFMWCLDRGQHHAITLRNAGECYRLGPYPAAVEH